MDRLSVATVTVVTAVLVLLTGCAAERDGKPSTNSTAPSSQASSGRPVNLELSDMDPCTLLTKEQRSRLHIGKILNSGQNPALEVPECSFRVWGHMALTISVDSHHSLDMWQNKAVPKESIEVDGFRGLMLEPGKLARSLAVDVHDGQQLVVDSPSGLSDEQLKRAPSAVKRWAKAALQTLRTLQ